MIYEVRKIADASMLEQCPVFNIDCFQWHSVYHPKALGRAGYVENKGFAVWLSCEEVHPKTQYKKNFQPVYKDSALEAFFQFDIHAPEYFNFEFNSSGACIAAFGSTRHLRKNLTQEQLLALNIRSKITPLGWQIYFFIPEPLIQEYQPHINWRRTKRLRCNFYKLSESPDIEHYASYAPVDSPAPNFHAPRSFADALIL